MNDKEDIEIYDKYNYYKNILLNTPEKMYVHDEIKLTKSTSVPETELSKINKFNKYERSYYNAKKLSLSKSSDGIINKKNKNKYESESTANKRTKVNNMKIFTLSTMFLIGSFYVGNIL